MLPVLLPVLLLTCVYPLHILLMHIQVPILLLESLRLPGNNFVEPLTKHVSSKYVVPASLLAFCVISFRIWVVQPHQLHMTACA